MSETLPSSPQARLIQLIDSAESLPRFFQSLPDIWCMTVIHRGNVLFCVNGGAYNAEAGDLILFPPQLCHAVIPSAERTHLTTLYFTVAPAPEELPDCTLFSVRSHSDVLSILKLVQNPAILSPAKDKLLEALLIQLRVLPSIQLSPLHPNTLPAQILAYLDEHFREDISLADLSAAFHLTHSHIIHIFKPVFDLSPIQYLIQRRIGEAQYLLLISDHTISDIAGLVGLFNRNYFYSSFKKLVGMTPTLYRATFAAQPAASAPQEKH